MLQRVAGDGGPRRRLRSRGDGWPSANAHPRRDHPHSNRTREATCGVSCEGECRNPRLLLPPPPLVLSRGVFLFMAYVFNLIYFFDFFILNSGSLVGLQCLRCRVDLKNPSNPGWISFQDRFGGPACDRITHLEICSLM